MSENTVGLDVSRISLKVTEDKMKVLMSCPLDCTRDENFYASVLENLKKLEVKVELGKKVLENIIKKASAEGKDLNDIPIVAGKPPEPPVDGKLEWMGDYFTEGNFIDPETKRIDFRQKIGIPAVDEGQLLVKVHPPVEGKEGSDIFGKRIPPPKTKAAKIRPGPNTVWDENENGLRAKCSGRVKLSGEVLDVENIYRINGDVGKETGNIKHNGQLVVQGNIEVNFKVETKGDIEVRGIIYACDILCGGNLTAREGINEDLEKKIIVKGDIWSKYINNATIESDALIVVQTEIFQSNVRTRGEINCIEGRIVGGEVVAAVGITVGEAGCKANVETNLIAGIDFCLSDKLESNTETLNKLKAMQKKLMIAEKQLNQIKKHMTPKQQEALTEITFRLSEANDEIEGLENENKEIRKKIREHRTARITIRKMVYPGVVLRISDCQHVINDTLAGPIVASLDKITQKIFLSSE